MPRRRSRSRSVHRYYDYESYSESSDDDRGRPIGRLINLIRPRSRSASININNNIYHGDNIFDEDIIHGPMYQAGDRAWAAPRRAGNNHGGNHVHHHHHHHYDESDDDDYSHGPPRHCHCRKCEAAEAAREQREKHEKAKKAAEELAKKVQKENDVLEKRLKALEVGRSRRLIRDRLQIDLDIAGCNGTMENIRGMRQQIRRTRSRSRPGVRWDERGKDITEIYTDA